MCCVPLHHLVKAPSGSAVLRQKHLPSDPNVCEAFCSHGPIKEQILGENYDSATLSC